MKVFVDTNIMFSAILFPGSMPDLAFRKALSSPYEAITSDYCLAELRDTFIRKFPNKEYALNAFLTSLIFSMQIVQTKTYEFSIETEIRDEKDRPVLRAAIDSESELLLTGDKDFFEANISNPKIISSIDFYNL